MPTPGRHCCAGGLTEYARLTSPSSPSPPGMLDERCHLLAERTGVFLAEIDLVLCAADAELQRLGCRASVEIVFEGDGYLLRHGRRPGSLSRPGLGYGVPSPANPLGAKGAGEAGATGSVPALANAVLDALRSAGVRALDMPYTPYRIWHSIREAQTRRAD